MNAWITCKVKVVGRILVEARSSVIEISDGRQARDGRARKFNVETGVALLLPDSRQNPERGSN